VRTPGASVLRPRATEKLDLECELAVVIGRRASRIDPGGGDLDAIFGYTILNDVTMRDLQREDRQWLRAKGSDGFAPMGPVVVTADEIGDPGALRLRSSVNGETWQDSTTAEMVFDVADPRRLRVTHDHPGAGRRHRHRHAGRRRALPVPAALPGRGRRHALRDRGIGAIENPVVDESRATRTTRGRPGSEGRPIGGG
jgi:hypothetical protein